MERAVAEYLVNALWQLPVLAAGAWLFVRLAQPSARVQHGMWLAILALAVLLPSRGPARATVGRSQATAMVTQGSTIAEQRLSFFPRARDLPLNPTVSRWLVRLYLAHVVLALLRIARGWNAAHRLVEHSRETLRHGAELAGLSSRFAVKLPQLRESAEVSSPMVVGVAAPVVLLPEGFDQFTADEVRAALCHELAHVKRRDYLMNMVCQVAALPLAWHPMVYEVQQRIRLTREMVCDAMAAEAMESHLGYAKCLLALAQSMLGAREMASQAKFVGLFSKNTLEERVMRLMETTEMNMRARVARVATGAAVMIATGSLAAIFHVTPTMAEQTNAARPAETALATGASQPQVEKPAAPDAPAAKNPPPVWYVTRSRKDPRLEEARQRNRAKAKEMLDDPAFKQRMEDARRQIEKAAAVLNSPGFKQQMEHAQQQMDQAKQQMDKAKVILDSADFKSKMEDAQRQMAKAAEVFSSPEFKQRIDEIKRQADEESREFDEPSSTDETAPTQ